VREGTHVADSASVTVKEAGEFWLKSSQAADLERTTLDQYRQHLRLHIEPLIGRIKLSQLNLPTVGKFKDRLREGGEGKKPCSPTMVKYVVRSLGALLADAQERGLIVRNPVRDLSRARSARKKGDNQDRHGEAEGGR
jgi:integrase